MSNKKPKKNTQIKIKKRRPKERFCPRGHDTFVCGRYESRRCKQCTNDDADIQYKPHPKPLKQFCVNGHKIAIVGRDKWGSCNKCKEIQIRIPQTKEATERYRQMHRANIRLLAIKTHKKRQLRIPEFGQEGIKEFYEHCPETKIVDHIIPLIGDLVSGLHVEWNLQYLTPKQNRFKWNKFDGTPENKSWCNEMKK